MSKYIRYININSKPIYYSDIDKYYKQSKFEMRPITKELCEQIIKEKYPYDKSNIFTINPDLCILYLSMNKEIDICYSENHHYIQNYFNLNIADAICDIKIHNATYAYLNCEGNKIELDKVKDIHTFVDFNLYNPLLVYKSINNKFAIDPMTIYTDGNRIEYKLLYFNSDIRKNIYDYGTTHTINKMKSRNLIIFAGRFDFPSNTCEYDYLNTNLNDV